MRTLSTIFGEGFECPIREDDTGRVYYTADGDIDADGANGQAGARPAYRVDNKGSEDLANGGMGVRNGRVVGVKSWFADIVIVDEDGHPREYPGGIIVSKTAYRYPGRKVDDPAAYVDSETVPYIVVPPIIIARTAGAVLGCRAVVTYARTGKRVEGVTADAGPRDRIGEVSIEMARRLGMNPDPRNGGEERPLLQYEVWPGIAARLATSTSFLLQRANGTYTT